MNSFAVQERVHVELSRLVNHQAKGYRRIADAVMTPRHWRSRQAAILTEQYKLLSRSGCTGSEKLFSVDVPRYRGANRNVRELMRYLSEHLREDLMGAFVHGSIGSDEEVSYSDLDALVILNDDVLFSPTRLAHASELLSRAQRFMLAQDPLQHHGWFVLTPFDLSCHCEAFFPVVLFKHARSLLNDAQGQQFSIRRRDSTTEMGKAFDGLARSLLRSLGNEPPKNTYQLKGLLSQFMLLPSLYLQVRDGNGVWKGDSFDLARMDFAPEKWQVMDHVSDIRRAWRVRVGGVRKRMFMDSTPLGGIMRSRLAPHVSRYGLALDTKTVHSMRSLVSEMIRNLSDEHTLESQAGGFV